MNEYAELDGNGKKTVLPLIEGTAGERAIDISKLRDQTGLITLDTGYGNTGSCQSAITFIDGEKGILRYRGIPIEELAEQSTDELGRDPTDEELAEEIGISTRKVCQLKEASVRPSSLNAPIGDDDSTEFGERRFELGCREAT